MSQMYVYDDTGEPSPDDVDVVLVPHAQEAPAGADAKESDEEEAPPAAGTRESVRAAHLALQEQLAHMTNDRNLYLERVRVLTGVIKQSREDFNRYAREAMGQVNQLTKRLHESEEQEIAMALKYQAKCRTASQLTHVKQFCARELQKMGKAAARDKMRVVALSQHNHHLALRNAELLKELGELREAQQKKGDAEYSDTAVNTTKGESVTSAPAKIITELVHLST